MKISLNWLKQYIDLPKNLTPKQLTHDLTMATVEVESVTDQAGQFEKMVVGKVVKIEKHPNADKLLVCKVETGDNQKSKTWPERSRRLKNQKSKTQIKNLKILNIVCGGKNLRKGMLVAVALPGAKVKWHGEGEFVKLRKTKIRGVLSEGMICASQEIGLENMFPCGEEEITDLSGVKGIKIGQSLAEAFGFDDVIIEIENKSLTNRPDLWCHYGIARELSAIYGLKLKSLNLFNKSKIQNPKSKINSKLKIQINNKKLCSRYIGCVVNNVKIKKSPEWLVRKLEAVGMRAINNIVDITNYVMMDVGEPMHAFDVKKLANTSRIKARECFANIIIRTAKKGEKIMTLDGVIRKLDPEMLVIADGKKPVALAGIMGGANSEVSGRTTDIILEAAIFDPVSVRKTAQKLGLRTEASIRFEKNLDPNLAELGMLRALKLIKEIMPQAEIGPMIDVNHSSKKKIIIKVGHNFLERRIGQKIDPVEIVGILERLGFIVKTQKSINKTQDRNLVYQIEVPSWRATGDISITEDIVEEVARIYGYDNLKEKTEVVELEKPVYQKEFEIEKKIKDYLSVGCGMNEVFNYPWAEESILRGLGILGEKMIELTNPPAEENKYLVISLIPNLIKNIKDNLRYFDEFKIFELARTYHIGIGKNDGDDKLPEQPKMLAGAVVVDKNKDAFLEVKGIIEQFPISNFQFPIKDCDLKFINKDRYLAIEMDGEKIGWLGELEDKISIRGGSRRIAGKNKNVGLFEINFSRLVDTWHTRSQEKKYHPLPQYPSIERDIAIEVGWQVKWAEVKDGILKSTFAKARADRQVQDDIIHEVRFLSEYDLGNKKSLAFRVVYQADDRTLKDEEVEVVEKKIIKMLEKKFEAELRS